MADNDCWGQETWREFRYWKTQGEQKLAKASSDKYWALGNDILIARDTGGLGRDTKTEPGQSKFR